MLRAWIQDKNELVKPRIQEDNTEWFKPQVGVEVGQMVGKVDSVLHQEDFTLQEVGRGFLLQCVLIGSDSDRTQFHSVDELKPLIVQHELLDSKKRIQ